MNDITTIECTMLLPYQHWAVVNNRLYKRGLEEIEIYGEIVTERRYLGSEVFEIDFRIIPRWMNEDYDVMSFETASYPTYSESYRLQIERMRFDLRGVQIFSGMPTVEQRDRLRSSRNDRRPKVCRGCSYYHEPAYPDDTLICAVHPEGSQSESCSDWMPGGAERSP